MRVLAYGVFVSIWTRIANVKCSSTSFGGIDQEENTHDARLF